MVRMHKNIRSVDRGEIIGVLSSVSVFVIIDMLALLIMGPYEASGVAAFSNPNDPVNILLLFLELLAVTMAILLIARFRKKQLIRVVVLASIALTVFSTLFILSATFLPEEWSLYLSIAVSAILVAMLVSYPEWYVVDLCGVILGSGVIALLSISLSTSLVIVLLVGLAIYDAISVYRTKHMIELADTVLSLKLPVIFVIPRTRHYSLIGETRSLKEKRANGKPPGAFFIGLGDIIMPGILVASTFHGIASNGILVALSVMLGTILGLIVLMRKTSKGKPQAGLPFLCTGAILGYVLSSYALFGALAGLLG